MKKIVFLILLTIMLTACVSNELTINNENKNENSNENKLTDGNIEDNEMDSKSISINQDKNDDSDTKKEKSSEVDNMAIVVFETSLGNFEVELNQEKAPISVENFLSYVNEGYYENTIFHRVIPDFMVQGGGFTEDMSQKDTKDPIKNEADNGLKNDKYTLAMARTSVVDSATSQFFINTNNNDFLNHGGRDFGYAVFGKVTSGTEVIDSINTVETGSQNGFQDVPTEPVIMTKVYVKE